MRYRPRWVLLGFGAIMVALLFTYPVWRKFLTGRGSVGAYAAATDAQREVFAKMNKENRGPAAKPYDVAATSYVAMLTVVPAPTSEQPTPSLPDAQIIRTGSFTGIDAVHTAAGDVTIYRSADGNVLLRFDDFTVTNGPQLQVYLCGAPTPQKRDDCGGGILEFAVGLLKGSTGNQQFAVPKELPMISYKSVMIYSEAVSAIYSYATLR